MSQSKIPPVLVAQYIEAEGDDRDKAAPLMWDLMSVNSAIEDSSVVLTEGILGSVKAFINDTGSKINLYTSADVRLNGLDFSVSSLTLTDGEGCIVWCVDQYNWFGVQCSRSS